MNNNNCDECNSDNFKGEGFIEFDEDDNTYCEETLTCNDCGHVWKLYFNLNN